MTLIRLFRMLASAVLMLAASVISATRGVVDLFRMLASAVLMFAASFISATQGVVDLFGRAGTILGRKVADEGLTRGNPLIRELYTFFDAILFPRLSSLSTVIQMRRRLRFAKPPGSRLLAIADFLVSRKTLERTVAPLVADWRHEYFEALRDNRQWKARWISVRYRYRFVIALGLSKAWSLLKEVASLSK